MGLPRIWKWTGWMLGTFVVDIAWMPSALRLPPRMTSSSRGWLGDESATFGPAEGNAISADATDPTSSPIWSMDGSGPAQAHASVPRITEPMGIGHTPEDSDELNQTTEKLHR